MLVRAIRWFLIAAPVVAGILVLILGTAGSISTSFGIVLIGIGLVVWMWNWFVRMSFSDDDDEKPAPATAPERQRHEAHPSQRLHPEPAPRHSRRKLTPPPRRRSG
jgi:hypothetical protein